MKFKNTMVCFVLATFVFLSLTPAVLIGQSLENLHKAAKKEGMVKFYSSGYPPLNKFIVERFKAKYPGVEVEVFRNQTAALCRTIEAQRMAKRVEADVVAHTDEGFFDKWKKEKFLMKYKNLSWDSVSIKDPEGYWTAFRGTIVLPCYNTEAISAQNAPKSYQDFLDPKWKGQIVTNHPEFGSSAMTFWKAIVEKYGWKYIEKLKNQDLLFVRGHGALTRTVLSKERPLGIEQLAYNTVQRQQKGLPMQHIFIPAAGEGGFPVTVAPAGIVAKTKHPNASKLFLNFLLGNEIQTKLPVMRGMFSVRVDIPPPMGLKKLSEYKLYPVDVDWLAANREKFIKKFNEKMGRK
jgi:iron(III) transport system substrate-binding protein